MYAVSKSCFPVIYFRLYTYLRIGLIPVPVSLTILVHYYDNCKP